MRVQTAVPASLIAAIAVIAATGCGSSTVAPSSRPAPAASGQFGQYEVRGVVVGTDAARRVVELDHEEIRGFMPAMTMVYEVADVALLRNLARGDRVRGTLRVDAAGWVITSLEKV